MFEFALTNLNARAGERVGETRSVQVSDFIAEFMADRGVSVVFEVAGGMVAPMLDSFARHRAVRVVTVHHEQAGAFAAESFARCTGSPAVAIGTAGPGALNLVTGIASCFYDSVPAIFLVGNVQTYLQRKSRPLRQFGLQETCFETVAKPISKGIFQPKRADEVPSAMLAAFELATEGRPGPVVVEIAFDIQIADLPTVEIATPSPRELTADHSLDKVLSLLDAAERPLIHAGGGVRRAGMVSVLRALAEHLSIPVTTSILGKDVIATDHPLNAGMPGTYGVRAANLVMSEADAVLVLGSRLDQGQIGADPSGWKRGKSIVHVDCDAGELGARVRGAIEIDANLRDFLPSLMDCARQRSWPVRKAWCERLAELRSAHSDVDELTGCPGINPNAFMRDLSHASRPARAFTVDAGQHTWWAAQSVRLHETQQFVASTGLWSMGTALPAAIGAAIAMEGPVVAIAGDGAMQMNIQELQTIVRNRFPIKIIVMNNQCLGMVRQFQDAVLDGRHFSTVVGYDTPDFVRVAEAYGLPARTLDTNDEVASALDWLWEDEGEARLLDVRIDGRVPVMPQVGFGRGLHHMESYGEEVRRPD
jgi:acetolactate synthase-1/2/3 large subunit